MSKKTKTWLIAIAILVIVFVLLPVGGIQYLRWDLARCYEMPPWEVKDQAKLINIGMTEEEAIAQIKGYTEMKKKDGKVHLMLRPKKRDSLIPAITHVISFRVDQDGSVTSVTTYDGSP